MNPRYVETASLGLIAVAGMFGGGALLAELSRFGASAIVALALVGIALLFGLARGLAAGGPTMRLRVSRDIAFVTCVLGAIAFVSSPSRWALGASIAAFEFGMILEFFGRLVPLRR